MTKDWSFREIPNWLNTIKEDLPDNYEVYGNHERGYENIDLVLRNRQTGRLIAVDFKGLSKNENLPPELIPFVKRKMERRGFTNFIILSVGNVNEPVKGLYEDRGINVFEMEKHKNNFRQDFWSLLHDIDEEK